MNGNPRWLLFDCFNTLVDASEDPWVLTSISHIPVEAGLFQSADEFRRAYDDWHRAQWLDGSWPEVNLDVRLHTIFCATGATKVATAITEQMIACFHDKYQETLSATPGVREMLDAWHGTARMAVVSNFYLPGWPARALAGFGLAEYFEFVLDSASLGWRKPDRRIYEAALRWADVNTADSREVLFVGDNRINDFEAPLRYGMQAYHLDRTRNRTEDLWSSFRPHAA